MGEASTGTADGNRRGCCALTIRLPVCPVLKTWAFECHHKVKLADGGAPFAQSNLEPRCLSCHFRANTRDDAPVSPARLEWREFIEEESNGAI